MINSVVYRIGFVCSVLLGILFFDCGGKKKNSASKESAPTAVYAPVFNSDSAYSFVKKQVSFGPRIPNTEAHRKMSHYLSEKCKEYGASVVTQEFNAVSYEGKKLFLKNIMAGYAPQKKKRILLATHWDTRPFADRDSLNPRAPFDGANDGASGVGVLLEIARLLGQEEHPEVGIDLLFFDGEDWGAPDGDTPPPTPPTWDSWWCLGSQYWSRNAQKSDYSAYYGILLDMVGAKDSRFFIEGVSFEYAPRIVDKIWDTAARLGYADYFVMQHAGAITDDHVYVNKWAKIPMVDIVPYQPGVGYFGAYHHSQKDNMDIISKETLGAVGRTIVQVLYEEAK